MTVALVVVGEAGLWLSALWALTAGSSDSGWTPQLVVSLILGFMSLIGILGAAIIPPWLAARRRRELDPEDIADILAGMAELLKASAGPKSEAAAGKADA